MELKIEYIPVSKLKPYEKNARRHDRASVEAIANSIKQFGFSDPVGIWGDNLIVEGHGRVQAAKKLGMKSVPCIRLDHLTDEQRRAYGLAHNKTAEVSDWDFDLVGLEINDLQDFDFAGFGFDLEEPQRRKKAENFTYRDVDPLPRLQHNVFDNFDRDFQPEYVGKYGFPLMAKTNTRGTEFARFCDWKAVQKPGNVIAHFYYDDYKFIQAWKEPELYVERLFQFKAVISPDFSLYTDFPMALQIMSCYRRQWVGAYWQSLGLDVIPDVVWGEPETYDFCFDGIPKGGTVAVSSVGVTNDKEWNGKEGNLFLRGYEEMLKRLEPEMVIWYGSLVDGVGGNIIRIPSYYEKIRKSLER